MRAVHYTEKGKGKASKQVKLVFGSVRLDGVSAVNSDSEGEEISWISQCSQISDHGVHPGKSHSIKRSHASRNPGLGTLEERIRMVTAVNVNKTTGYTGEDNQWISQRSRDSFDSWGAGRLPTQQSARLGQRPVENQWLNQCSHHPFNSFVLPGSWWQVAHSVNECPVESGWIQNKSSQNLGSVLDDVTRLDTALH
eukprot:4855481-Amphidinium_carterae.1